MEKKISTGYASSTEASQRAPKRCASLGKRASFGAAALTALLLAGPAQAALQDRDLDGDTVVDAFYDTELDITWLRNANVNGVMNWWNAVAWANGFSFAGYSDWRLPTSDGCGGYGCTGSELGHLWHVELGNPVGGPMTNTGSFQNLLDTYLWTATQYAPEPADYAWAFQTNNGLQFFYYKPNANTAMVVRDGDVPAIPEPETVGLMLAGLLVLAATQKHRAR